MVKAETGLGRALARRGDYRDAVRAFDAALALAPQEFEPALLRAQALSWDNRQAQAEAAYRALLEREPGNERALLGLARVQTWRGRQREALATLALLPPDVADPAEASFIAAEAQQWVGRPDRAVGTLEARLATARGDSRAAWLKDRIERENRHEARFDARRYDQSDGLDIEQFNLGADWRFDDGRARIGPRLAYFAFDPFTGPGDVIEVTRIGASGGYRISDAVDANASIGVDTIDSPGPGGRDDFLTYDAFVTLFPDDRWRIDIGAKRFLFDSEPTLRNRLVVEEYKVSADHLPTERSRLTLRGAYADYSDGNRQAWWQAEFEQRLALEPRIHLALRYTGTDFTLVNQEGYFSPDEYHSIELLGRIEGRIGQRTTYGLRAGAGAERDVGQSDRFIVNGGIFLRRQLSDAIDVEAAYDYTSSSAASSTGFERGIGRISLIARF
jgi:tetratricopeptide (TPR) repeat protein